MSRHCHTVTVHDYKQKLTPVWTVQISCKNQETLSVQIQGASHLKQQFLECGQVAVAGRQRLAASPWILPDWPEPTNHRQHKFAPLLGCSSTLGMPGLVHYLHALRCRQCKPWHCHVFHNGATNGEPGRKQAKCPSTTIML